VLEESIASGVSPSLVFDVVLSDASSFFHASSKQAGNMEVDIGAWRTARFPVDGGTETPSFLRKQLFRMPVSGVAGLDVAQIEDYQYYALLRATDATPRKGERLEYGMKIFARDLPDGERFSIEVVVIVEQAPVPADASEAPPCTLRVAYAIAKTSGGDDMDDDPLQSALVHGTVRGLKRVWTRVANVIQDAVQRASRTSNTVAAEDVRHRLHIEGKLPHHDELTSTIIEAITELY
jgi:hypothetical protein